MIRMTAITLLLAAAPAAAQECEFEASRDANMAAESGARLQLIARSGSLRIEGRDGLNEVRVRGRACASTEELLERLRLRTERRGDVVEIEVEEMDDDGWSWTRNQYARLDLVIEVPAGMVADIEDGSGAMFIRGVGELEIEDGSGDIELEDIGGIVRIDDGSGGVTVTRVQGDVTVDDGSGEVTIREITGSVTIDDGSGEISVANVSGDVRIPDDGSGDVDVRDVEGDLIVGDKGGGDVRFSAVRGRVDVPDDDRHWRRRGR